MKKLFFLLCILTVFFACSDNNDNGEPTPPIENLKMPSAETPFTTGQSVTIEGKGFTTISQIWLRMATKATGDVQTKVTEVTDNSIVFEVPEGVEGKQNVILKQDGKEYKLGEMTFEISATHKLYAYKVKENGNQIIKQIVEIDPIDGQERIITTLSIPSEVLEYLVYLPSTKEIIGKSSKGSTNLIKVNTSTGNTESVALKDNAWYGLFFVDDKENLYAYKTDNNNSAQIITLDPKTGDEKLIMNMDINILIKNLIFKPSTNEIIGYVVNENYDHKFIIINISTLTIKSVPTSDSYTGFVLDDKENLYANKRNYTAIPSTLNNQLVKISLDSGNEQNILSLSAQAAIVDLNFSSSNKEIIGMIDNEKAQELVKFKLNKLETSIIALENLANYDGLIINK